MTTHLNDGGKAPRRSRHRNAHAYLGAPYGIYDTKDGFLALAMGSLTQLGALIGCADLAGFDDVPADRFALRDKIKRILATQLASRTTDEWLAVLEPADYWCSDVFNYGQLMKQAGYKAADMEQVVQRDNGTTVRTTRCPIRIDGKTLRSRRAAPVLGDANAQLAEEFLDA